MKSLENVILSSSRFFFFNARCVIAQLVKNLYGM